VYITSGGNRGGFSAMTRATFLAMGLSGLWHGASWNYVLWGVYHASLITGYRLVTPRIPAAVRDAAWAKPVAVALMYGWTCLGWLIFRETDVGRLMSYFRLIPWQMTTDQAVVTVVLAGVCAACAAPLVLALAVERKVTTWAERPAFLPVETTFWAACAIAILTMVREHAGDFIYFQF
jgi:D-alanyl-lipoteichoic acid acyltransferase DltB (MBOAT superfamily)